MSILSYAKSHPWATGVIAVVGGFLFIVIVRGSGGSGSAAQSGPSEAEVLADAQIQSARISAQAQASQAGAAIQAAQIGAGVQLNSDNRAAEVAMRQLEVSRDLGLETIGAQERAVTTEIAARQSRYQSIINSLGTLKKNNRDDILQALITGQPFNERNQDGASSIISSVGGMVASIGSLFSDQRLKENIRHVGFDKNGRDVFEYNYKGSNTKRQGYMAQAIARAEPEKIVHDPSGYLRVSYG